MHVVVRHYKGSSKLIDELIQRRQDVEDLIRGVEGFVAYYLIKTSDGGASISVFADRAGTEESTRRAAAYLKENLEGVAAGPPEVIDGEAVIQFAK
jgi:heme-degrading monooxygenase HmoA